MKQRVLHLDNVKQAMSRLGFNQAAIARSLEVSRQTVSQWLNGEAVPRPAKLLQLSRLLQLTFNDVVLVPISNPPEIAFRTHRAKKNAPEKLTNALDMADALASIAPYLNRSLFSSVFRAKQVFEYEHIQSIGQELRSRMKLTSDIVAFSDIMKLYAEFQVVLIPVLWGVVGDNGLYIHLPEHAITFVYLNIEKPLLDISFWALHELAHAMTRSMEKSDAEAFSDALAAAILFPQEQASAAYDEVCSHRSAAMRVQTIKSIALRHQISPFTVFKEIERYAKEQNHEPLGIDIGGAASNVTKAAGLYSEQLFESLPTPEEYIEVSNNELQTPFFDAVAKYIQESGSGAGIVQRVLNISITDAKGVYKALAK